MDAKRTLIIGTARRCLDLFEWMKVANEYFEVPIVAVEDDIEKVIEKLPGVEVIPLQGISNISYENYSYIFICSEVKDRIKKILLKLGVKESTIFDATYIYSFLDSTERMNYVNKLHERNESREQVTYGEFSYGEANIYFMGNTDVRVNIGKFCSIANDVLIIAGGGHRTDWVTTYPFNMFMPEYGYIKGHPATKGDINIGNDVWIGRNAIIMSGVTIGDGAVIGAGALISKDVEPYAIVGGNPAKTIRYRFEKEIIDKLLEIQWWNWSKEEIYEIIPLLQSSHPEKVIEHYEKMIKNK